ncbi:hypothetical protein D8674_033352 [Pyrus ussuriensis x Pyrus communis]|uniref:Reverse transcriptase Ty1/copia-type domain-containing protein n=1 Tax=Pyrus ussuriensis x Pyrus communis TaxID=2448454 RepID=A0A5N5HP34_9ROSA|nr:hypothetical protein D8674_033352 [Pyrus ussuriensis x Pyrus communis]
MGWNNTHITITHLSLSLYVAAPYLCLRSAVFLCFGSKGSLPAIQLKVGGKWVEVHVGGNKLLDHFDGSMVCPSKFVMSAEIGVTKELIAAFQDWETIDLSLLSLLIETLTDDTIEHVIGCKTAAEAWTNLEERYASVSQTGVNHLKTELHTVQKGGDLMDKYLLRIKSIKDQLPNEYATIRTVILAKDSNVTTKEFRVLLIGDERENDVVMNSLAQNMATLYMQGNGGGASSSLYNNGASSVITSTPLPQQMSFLPQPQIGQPSYFPDHNSLGSSDNSRQHQPSSQYTGAQQRFYNGGQSRGNNNYKLGFKGKSQEQLCIQSVKFVKEGDTLLPHAFIEMLKVLHHALPLSVKSMVRRGIVCLNVIIGGITLINPLDLLLLLLHFLAPRAWNSKFISVLPSLGFTVSQSDTSLFIKADDKDIIILLLYVDDIIMTGFNVSKVQDVITALSEIFDLKDMGKLTYFLGLHIQYKSNDDVFISQSKYAKKLIKRAGMENCRPAPTPSKPHTQSIVGALQYLTFTRPDIAHSVNVICQYMTNPTDAHMSLVKRILRYLQGTLQCGITYSSNADIYISAYSDADWVSNTNTRRSITTYVVFLGSNPISWQLKKQSSVSRSSTEAEFKALANCAADMCWIRSLMKDLNQFLPAAPNLYCDNLSALALSTNPVAKEDVVVHYVSTDNQVADVLTKGLHSPVFIKHYISLNLAKDKQIMVHFRFSSKKLVWLGWVGWGQCRSSLYLYLIGEKS